LDKFFGPQLKTSLGCYISRLETSMWVNPYSRRRRFHSPPTRNPPPRDQPSTSNRADQPHAVAMVFGEGRGGHSGGRVGIAGFPSPRARALSAAEELERQRRVSNYARIRSSYRYLRQGCKPPVAFKRSESRYNGDLPPSSCGSTSCSSDPPPKLQRVVEFERRPRCRGSTWATTRRTRNPDARRQARAHHPPH
jgi:hypothetical protein